MPGTTRPEASQENLASNHDLEDVREIFGQVTAMRPQFLKWAAG